MSLEVGAGIKRQAEEGFLFLLAGGKECILELHSLPRRSRGGAQFCGNGRVYRGAAGGCSDL